MGASKSRVTLKALANVSPGRGPHAGSPRGVEVFALKPWDQKCPRQLFATLGCNWRTLSALLLFGKRSPRWVAFPFSTKALSAFLFAASQKSAAIGLGS